jgi:hypothetical protein
VEIGAVRDQRIPLRFKIKNTEETMVQLRVS